jgi:methylglutaconyl-CoA hydratase
MTNEGNIEIQTNGRIAELKFSHPNSNSLPGKLLKSIYEEILNLDKNPDIRVVILKSVGDKAFCAGASFDELASIETFEQGKEFFSGFARIINAIRKSKKIYIARIHSKAVGGGVGLAATCDYAIAHTSASVKLSELAVGIGPFVVGPAVERKIGLSAYSSMSLDVDWYTADWAMQKGLYHRVYNTIEELDNGINSFANKLSESNPGALEELKRVFWQGTEDWDELLSSRAEISGRLVLSDFTKEFIKKFKKN